jgi:suppressor of fused-like protein
MFDDGESILEQALAEAYPDCEPVRFEVTGDEKLDIAGCLAIRVEEPVPHWVVVSRGFTELGDKVEEDPEVSGWGFELVCRLPARTEEPDFGWIVGWMQSVSQHLADKVSSLEPYQHLPIWKARNQDELAAVIVVEESSLSATRSANGYLTFFQLVGITTAEYQAIEDWDGRGLAELIHERDPLLLTDAQRTCWLRDPEFALAVTKGRERDGSSNGVQHNLAMFWASKGLEIELHLSLEAARILKASMRARLAHGKPMYLFGERRRIVRPDGSLALRSQLNVVLYPEKGRSSIEVAEDGTRTCAIRLSADGRAEIASMPDEPGEHVFPHVKGVRFVVVTAERLREPGYPASPAPATTE